MTAVTVAQRMTAEEFVEAPVPDRGRPWNLVDGEVVMNQPTVLHGRAQFNVLYALGVWTRAQQAGMVMVPIDVRLDDLNVFAPDVLWYSEEHLFDESAPPPYPMPDLAVEVRSPTTWRYDIGAKKAGYERHGLRELWLVDTAADEVLVFRRSAADVALFDIAVELDRDQQLTSPLLPGFALALAELFPAQPGARAATHSDG